MRRSFDVIQYLQGLLPYCIDAAAHISLVGRACLKLLEFNRQKSKTLTDIFVKVSGDSVALLLLGLNDFATYVGKGFFRKLSLGSVRDHAYDAYDPTLLIKEGSLCLLHPNHGPVRT